MVLRIDNTKLMCQESPDSALLDIEYKYLAWAIFNMRGLTDFFDVMNVHVIRSFREYLKRLSSSEKEELVKYYLDNEIDCKKPFNYNNMELCYDLLKIDAEYDYIQASDGLTGNRYLSIDTYPLIKEWEGPYIVKDNTYYLLFEWRAIKGSKYRKWLDERFG